MPCANSFNDFVTFPCAFSYALGMGDISNKITEYTSELVTQEKVITDLKDYIIQTEKGRDDLKRY